jgi:hypothetical protein
MGRRARERTLSEHTVDQRAREFVRSLEQAVPSGPAALLETSLSSGG